MVDGARTVGMLALLFEHDAQAIAAIEAWSGDRRGSATRDWSGRGPCRWVPGGRSVEVGGHLAGPRRADGRQRNDSGR